MFSIIKSGMSSAMHELSVISNNISNANSNGFKKSLVAFSDFAGGLLPDAVQNSSGGMGSFVDETRISDGQGAVLGTEKRGDFQWKRRSRRVASDSARSYRTRPFQSLPRAGVRAARRSLLAPSSTPTS